MVWIVYHITINVPTSEDEKHNERCQHQPNTLMHLLLQEHQLVHAYRQVSDAEAHHDLEPSLKVMAILFVYR
jgi:hypothetical protein